ncbi:MAG: phosphate regulon transcriptional regulator PhoB [Gammaproteobacteria bacterium]|nr:phosphate regulon transcriptional regulator PhoB [Gammaproteobacteria bacterium]
MAKEVEILIVEDERAIREMVVMALGMDGLYCVEAEDVNQAQRYLTDNLPSLIILDRMLPGISGIEFARRVRRDKNLKNIPIIMLTAMAEEQDMIQGLDSGADDYMVKPFSTRELRARVRALLRRSQGAETGADSLSVGHLRLDPISHRVYSGDQVLELGPTEFRLLRFFMENQERVFNRAQILDKVWGMSIVVEERTVDVHIRRLRKALADYGHETLIQTVRGEGYRFSSKA